MNVLAIDGSPTGQGFTQTVLADVLAGARAAGVKTRMLALATPTDEDMVDHALTELHSADAFVLGSPVYRGSFSTPMKAFLDRLPNGMCGQSGRPITGRAVAIVMTGADLHHFLALDSMRNVLAGRFAAHVLSPGLYVPAAGYAEDRQLNGDMAELARAQGVALVALARAVGQSNALRSIRPQL